MDNNVLAEPVHIIRAQGSCLGTEMQREFVICSSNNLHKKIHQIPGILMDKRMAEKLINITIVDYPKLPFLLISD